jgi:hypothetical protein
VPTASDSIPDAAIPTAAADAAARVAIFMNLFPYVLQLFAGI